MMKPPFYYRYIILGVLASIVGAAIIVQIIRIQNSDIAGELQEQGEAYSGEYKTIYPERGKIYDRWGSLLAGNETVYEIGLDLASVENPQTIASDLASVVGLDYATVLAAAETPFIEGQSVYYKIADSVSSDKIDQLNQLMDQYAEDSSDSSDEPSPSLQGLVFNAHLKRSYPEGTLGSNIIGFYSFLDPDEGKGYYGVEEQYNDLLSGTPKMVYVPFNPNEAQDETTEVPAGTDVILTIDREIQAMVEQQLDKHIESTGATSGTVIVMDPETGEILAMATTPRLNPNEYWNYEQVFTGATPYNRAIGTTYEPGSVFKVLTMAAALDTGTVTPETPFLDTGVYELGGAYFYNWDSGAWGQQDMVGCMQHSLNVCLVWVAEQLGATDFYKYIQAFGIGHRTGIDLAGEVTFPLRLPGDGQWILMDMGTNSFGQGLAATPIQMITAISAIANDGKMMVPHVLRSTIENGRQYDTTPQVISQPVSAETAHTLTSMLARSLEEESSSALVPGYQVAGKTGTAQIPSSLGYEKEVTNASFVGWGPVDNPKFIVYVWLEKPVSSTWGSVVAAPLFSDVVQNLVVLMDIPPDSVRQQINGQ